MNVLKVVLSVAVIWFFAIMVVMTFFVEARYDCSKGSTSCTREKLWFFKKW